MKTKDTHWNWHFGPLKHRLYSWVVDYNVGDLVERKEPELLDADAWPKRCTGFTQDGLAVVLDGKNYGASSSYKKSDTVEVPCVIVEPKRLTE